VIAFSACDRHDACASSGKGGANSSHQLHCHCPEGVRLGSCLLWRGTLKLSLLIAILLTGFTRQECTITRGPVRGSHVSPIGILALSPPAFFHQSDFVAQSAVCRSRQGSEFAAGFWVQIRLPMLVPNRASTEDQNLLSCFIAADPCAGFAFGRFQSAWNTIFFPPIAL